MMDTQQVMRLALKLAGLKAIPADSEVHVKGKLRKVLVAIDVGISELLLARNLGCDGVVSHHPAGGTARLEGYKVFSRHVDQLKEAGVSAGSAEDAVKTKYRQLEVQHHPDNYDQTPSAAKKMRMPLLTIHSPCDEIGRQILLKTIDKLDKDATVGQLVSRIGALSEFKKAKSRIQVRLGSPKNKAGTIAISHAAYTNGGYDIARTYFQNGVETLSYIHIAEPDLARLGADGNGNLIVLGHIASDWLGINPLLAEMEKKGVEIVATTDLH